MFRHRVMGDSQTFPPPQSPPPHRTTHSPEAHPHKPQPSASKCTHQPTNPLHLQGSLPVCVLPVSSEATNTCSCLIFSAVPWHMSLCPCVSASFLRTEVHAAIIIIVNGVNAASYRMARHRIGSDCIALRSTARGQDSMQGPLAHASCAMTAVARDRANCDAKQGDFDENWRRVCKRQDRMDPEK